MEHFDRRVVVQKKRNIYQSIVFQRVVFPTAVLSRNLELSVHADYQQTTKKKGTILRLSLSNLKVLEVYIKMNSIYIPTILVYMIANCNTYSHFIHRLIHTEKTSKYLF